MRLRSERRLLYAQFHSQTTPILNSSFPAKILSFQRAPLIPPNNFLPNKPASPNKHSELAPHCSAGEERDSSSYYDVLQRFRGSRNAEDAERLHLEIVRNGFGADLFLSNCLVNLYAKGGSFVAARRVFHEMPERNVVSWTCLISGFTHFGLSYEACGLFRSMVLCGVEPTQFSFGSVLHACQESGPGFLSFGLQVHGRIAKSRFSSNVAVCNALISMYGGCSLSSASDAQRVFDCTAIKSLITWNSIISVHSMRGNAACAFELFSKMQMQTWEFYLMPNEFTYGSLIPVTYSLFYGGCLLEQLLAKVSKVGFAGDLYVGSALVSAFSRSGMLDFAKDIFLLINEKNAVTMNGLMVGLVRQNLGEEAVEVFRKARDVVALNPDSFVILLSALVVISDSALGREKGKEVHAHIIRTDLINSKEAVGNGLINTYARCDAIDDARKVFHLMDAKDQVSWNTVICGLDQNGLFEETLETYRLMLQSSIKLSEFSLISALSSCASLRLLHAGLQLHCIGAKLGLDVDVSVSNSLLTMYGECSNLSECWKVFNWMSEYDQISWNCMIGSLACNEASLSESVEVFLNMMRCGWHPNKVTFINLFAAFSPLNVIDIIRQVHGLSLKHGMSEETDVQNVLLTCYSKAGELDSCESLFLEMADRRSDVSWNSMASGYFQNGCLQKAVDFLWFMMHNGQQMDCFTISSILSVCASVAVLERGMEVHALGTRLNLHDDVVVGSALLDMYSKCGRVDYASRVFRSMVLKNEFSWNSMISGYSRHGLGQQALQLFNEMQKANHQPDLITFVGVLSACSHAGLVKEGLDYFESMKKFGLVPRIEHYSCVVDLLGRAGKLDKMEEFIRSMPIRPNALIWRTVVVACRKSKGGEKRELCMQATQMLLELEPQNPVNYVLVSNLYAAKGSWEAVAKARAAMRGSSVKKDAGCSWVTLKDGVHVFVAGDKSHPNSYEIYANLQILLQKIKDAGYVPQAEFALYDLEDENKEELLSYHSEKLAVAFVLTRPSSTPIRIMKNLRICGDCHSAFGYISKVFERKITLRDSIRFHHFEDGRCSCGDYW